MGRTGNRSYFLANALIEDYNVIIDGQNLFDQPVKIDMRT